MRAPVKVAETFAVRPTIESLAVVRGEHVAVHVHHLRRLDALFWLGNAVEEGDEGPDVRASRMSGAALLKALLASAMNIRYHAPERLGRRLRFVEQVARVVPVYDLEYRRDFALMPRVAQEMRKVLAA